MEAADYTNAGFAAAGMLIPQTKPSADTNLRDGPAPCSYVGCDAASSNGAATRRLLHRIVRSAAERPASGAAEGLVAGHAEGRAAGRAERSAAGDAERPAPGAADTLCLAHFAG